MTRLSGARIANLGRGGNVNITVLVRAREALNYDIADICEVVSANPKGEIK